MCWSLFLIKLQAEYCENLKDTHIAEHLRMAAFKRTSSDN